MQAHLRVAALVGALLIAAGVPAAHAQSEAGGFADTCYSNAIPSSSLLLNYTRSETSAYTTFSFLVQPKGALAGSLSSVGVRIASQVAAMPASIVRSTPVGDIEGPPAQFVWPAMAGSAQVYSIALSAAGMGRPFYLTSLCQQGITILDASGTPVFQQPLAADGQPGTCILFFEMSDGSCGYQLLADRELPAASIPPPPAPIAPATAPKSAPSPPMAGAYGSYYGAPSGVYGMSPPKAPPTSPPAPLFGPPVSMGPKAPAPYGFSPAPPSYGFPPAPASYGFSPAPASYGYGSYGYSAPPASGYGGYAASPTYGAASYGGSYGSLPAAGYYSVRAVLPTLFGNGRSLLSALPEDNVIAPTSGLDHFGSAFPSNTWQFLHHKSPGTIKSPACPEAGSTAEFACQAQRICGKCSTASKPDASTAFTIVRSIRDSKTTYNLTAGPAADMPTRISLRVGSQSPSSLTGRPALASHWLRGAVQRDCSSHTGLKHTIAWEQASIQKAWSAGSPRLFQVEASGDVDLFGEELEVIGSKGAQLLIRPGVALLSIESPDGCTWQALDMRYA